ncbi:Cytoplasmic FMR1-interacting protein [Diplonema papillatum]|nr:Cytoplasmic FMR1-interacting protein [Diplonema papillatum]
MEGAMLKVDGDPAAIKHWAAKGYSSKVAREEFDHIHRLDALRQAGESLAVELYSHRPLPLDAGDTAQHAAACAALAPSLPVLRSLSEFTAALRRVCGGAVEFCARAEGMKAPVSDSVLWALANACDACFVVDGLSGLPGLTSDWVGLREQRSECAEKDGTQCAVPFDWGEAAALVEQLVQSHDGGGAGVLPALKQAVTKPAGWQDVLSACVNLCTAAVLDRTYLTPRCKYTALRVSALFVGWVDERKAAGDKEKPRKGLGYDACRAVQKRHPHVPLFAELAVRLSGFVLPAANIDLAAEYGDRPKLEAAYAVTEAKLKDFRSTFLTWASTFSLIRLTLAAYPTPAALASQWSPATKECIRKALEDFWQSVITGIKLLTDLTTAVHEQNCWKAQHPAPGTRPSYSAGERRDLLEMMGMIKGISGELSSAAGRHGHLLRARAYDALQRFVQVDLRDLLRKTKKEGKLDAHAELRTIRDCFGDWREEAGGVAPAHDRALEGLHDDPKAAGPAPAGNWQVRCVMPGAAQVAVLCAVLEALISARSPGMRKSFRNPPDFQEKRKKVIEDALSDFRWYRHLANLPDTAAECADLSFLWLNRDACGRDAGDLASSLPYAVMGDLVSSTGGGAPVLSGTLFLPVCVYNDVADTALHRWRDRGLFERVEEEAGSAVDATVERLAETVFASCKSVVAWERLEKEFTQHLPQAHGQGGRKNNGNNIVNSVNSSSDNINSNSINDSSANVSIDSNKNGVRGDPQHNPGEGGANAGGTASFDRNVDGSRNGGGGGGSSSPEAAAAAAAAAHEAEGAGTCPGGGGSMYFDPKPALVYVAACGELFARGGPRVAALGRRLDVNRAVAELVDAMLVRDLEAWHDAITQAPLSDVCFHRSAFRVLHDAHTRLLEMGLGVGDWEDLLDEARAFPSVLHARTKLAGWAANEAAALARQWCFNTVSRRFIPSDAAAPRPQGRPQALAGSFGSHPLAAQHGARHAVYRQYVGREHFDALTDLLTRAEVYSLASDLQHLFSSAVADLARSIADSPIRGAIREVPSVVPGGRALFSSAFDSFFAVFRCFKTASESEEVRAAVFAPLRTCGNVVALLQVLDQAVEWRDVLSTIASAPLSGLQVERRPSLPKDSSKKETCCSPDGTRTQVPFSFFPLRT